MDPDTERLQKQALIGAIMRTRHDAGTSDLLSDPLDGQASEAPSSAERPKTVRERSAVPSRSSTRLIGLGAVGATVISAFLLLRLLSLQESDASPKADEQGLGLMVRANPRRSGAGGGSAGATGGGSLDVGAVIRDLDAEGDTTARTIIGSASIRRGPHRVGMVDILFEALLGNDPHRIDVTTTRELWVIDRWREELGEESGRTLIRDGETEDGDRIYRVMVGSRELGKITVRSLETGWGIVGVEETLDRRSSRVERDEELLDYIGR